MVIQIIQAQINKKNVILINILKNKLLYIEFTFNIEIIL